MNAGYVERAPTSREIEELKMAMSQNISSRNVRQDTPDHHTVGSMVNLLKNDMNQLIEEIGELRTRLAPILTDREMEKATNYGMPTLCQVAAELSDVFQRVGEARRLVYMTITSLDL